MKRFLLFFAILLVLTAAGCSSTEAQPSGIPTQGSADYSVSSEITEESQDDTSSITDAWTEEIDLPPEETDCLAVADEYALAFQSLFLKYLQYQVEELSIIINEDFSLHVEDDGIAFFPVVDDEIKCCNDLKNIFMEYCTDEFAQKLLDKALYRDFDNSLYKTENGMAPAAKFQFGCYINDCVLDGNKMTVDFISIGSDNEKFDIDLEYYTRMITYDQHFEMTLVWENDKWFISDITSGCEDKIGYSYRPDITKSEHEEVDLPPEETDCLAVADEYALAFQSLFLKYLQYQNEELSLIINEDFSLLVQDNGLAFFPVVDDEIKCCNDLKNIFMEYCTVEFAQKLLDEAVYRDFDNSLYKAENGAAPAAKFQFGCYINDCVLDGNKMTVDFINIGSDNENFDIDLEYYTRMMIHDEHLEMTLLWENDKWFISDISHGYEDVIGYAYRPDITRSMNNIES